jgi:hypothetical protein
MTQSYVNAFDRPFARGNDDDSNRRKEAGDEATTKKSREVSSDF